VKLVLFPGLSIIAQVLMSEVLAHELIDIWVMCGRTMAQERFDWLGKNSGWLIVESLKASASRTSLENDQLEMYWNS